MNLTQATNSATPVDFGGRTFPVRQLKLREWGRLHAWLAASTPNPVFVAGRAIEQARRLGAPFGPELREELLAQAHDEARRWPPPVGSRAWLREVCSTNDGEREFYRAVFAAGGTELADDELDDLIRSASEDEAAEVLRLAYFGDPPNPKATPPERGETEVRAENETSGTATPTTGADSSTP